MKLEYVANVIYEGGQHRSIPLINISSKKELLQYMVDKDMYIEEIINITITVREDGH